MAVPYRLALPILEFIGPLLRVVRSAALRPFERWLRERNHRLLRHDCLDALDRWLAEHGAVVLPPESKPGESAFDYACVDIAVESMRLKVHRCREEVWVELASDGEPFAWHDLEDIIRECQGERPPFRGAFRDLWDVSAELERHWPSVVNRVVRAR